MVNLLLKVRVERVLTEADRIKSFVLSRTNGKPFPALAGGAHIGVQVPGIGTRHYSVCSDPSDQGAIRIAVLRETNGRGGSAWMHDNVRQGQHLVIASPKNGFPVDARADHHVMIAGGIGITPFLSMIHEIASREQSFELHYCAKDPARMAFHDELAKLAQKFDIRFYFDHGDPSQGCNFVELLSQPQPTTHVYCCGPNGLISAVKSAAAAWGDDAVHFEEFVGVSPIPAGEAEPFQIHLKRSGGTIAVGPSETALDALTRAGVDVPGDCRTGACGTCILGYADGHIDHRDVCLTDSERKTSFTPCVSRATDRVVIDL